MALRPNQRSWHTHTERNTPTITTTAITTALVALLVFQMALPALAYGVDSGNVTCTNKIPVHSKSTYDVSIQVPSGSTVASYFDGASPVTRTTTTQVYGPNSWKVLSTDGTVYTADTYAYCWGV